jgi:hypothetical protein
MGCGDGHGSFLFRERVACTSRTMGFRTHSDAGFAMREWSDLTSLSDLGIDRSQLLAHYRVTIYFFTPYPTGLEYRVVP